MPVAHSIFWGHFWGQFFMPVPNLLTLVLEHSRALLVNPLFLKPRLIHTVEVIGSNPRAPTIFSRLA
jgi:hypothetical protein